MPTTKPRVHVTLEPDTHDVIERLATLQGKTRGAVISEMLDSIVPAISRTVTLLEAAAAAPEMLKENFRAVIEGAQSDLAEASGDSAKQLDILMNKLNDQGNTDEKEN